MNGRLLKLNRDAHLGSQCTWRCCFWSGLLSCCVAYCLLVRCSEAGEPVMYSERINPSYVHRITNAPPTSHTPIPTSGLLIPPLARARRGKGSVLVSQAWRVDRVDGAVNQIELEIYLTTRGTPGSRGSPKASVGALDETHSRRLPAVLSDPRAILNARSLE